MLLGTLFRSGTVIRRAAGAWEMGLGRRGVLAAAVTGRPGQLSSGLEAKIRQKGYLGYNGLYRAFSSLEGGGYWLALVSQGTF